LPEPAAKITLMERAPRFNFHDVLWAPARALSAKQIFSMTVFLVAALLVYDLFYYLAFLIDGEPLGIAFSAYGLFPFVDFAFNGPAARICFLVGVTLSLFALMLGFFAVASINVEAVRGNRFFSARGAVRFALVRFRQLFLSELTIVLFVAFIVLLFFLLGLVSRIPLIGQWLYTLLFVVPNFIVALFSVFIIFVFTLTILLLPAVAAAEREGETFAAILETFSTVIRQPFRWAGYTAYSFVAAKVCSFLYAYFCYRAVQFMVWASSLGGGDALERLVRSGLGHLPVREDLVRELLNVFPGVPFGISVLRWRWDGSDQAVSYLMAVMLFLVFATVAGYLLAIVAAAQARGYVALRYIKDQYSIADEDPLFFTDEHVNPEVVETDVHPGTSDNGSPS